MIPFIVFLVASGVAFVVTPKVVSIASAHRLFDHPDGGRRVHTRPTPRLGGIPVVVATLVGLAAGAPWSWGGRLEVGESLAVTLLLGSCALAVVGLVDDMGGLRARTKLAAQLLVGMGFFAGGVRIEEIALGDLSVATGLLALPVTLLWVVAVTNAINLIDGLDGLAAGVAIIALGFVAAGAVLLGNPAAVPPAVALLGALCGFLPYNFRPARIFLGDAGSLFVGSLVAALSITGLSAGGAGSLGVPAVAVVAVPLLDTCLAVLRRWLRGAPLAAPDRRHVHHRLMDRGLGHRDAVLVLYGAAAALAAAGAGLAALPGAVTPVAAAAACGLTAFLALRVLRYHELGAAARHLRALPGRLRRAVRAEIRLADLRTELRRARSVAELNAVLDEAGAAIGAHFVGVCLEDDVHHGRPLVIGDGAAMGVPKVEFPLPSRVHGLPPHVLRVWTALDRGEHGEVAGTSEVLAADVRRWWNEAADPATGPRVAGLGTAS